MGVLDDFPSRNPDAFSQHSAEETARQQPRVYLPPIQAVAPPPIAHEKRSCLIRAFEAGKVKPAPETPTQRASADKEERPTKSARR